MNYHNRTKWKGWSPLEHRLFPQDLRYSVRVMLMCQNRVIQDSDAVAVSELKSCHSSSGTPRSRYTISTPLLILVLTHLSLPRCKHWMITYSMLFSPGAVFVVKWLNLCHVSHSALIQTISSSLSIFFRRSR